MGSRSGRADVLPGRDAYIAFRHAPHDHGTGRTSMSRTQPLRPSARVKRRQRNPPAYADSPVAASGVPRGSAPRDGKPTPGPARRLTGTAVPIRSVARNAGVGVGGGGGGRVAVGMAVGGGRSVGVGGAGAGGGRVGNSSGVDGGGRVSVGAGVDSSGGASVGTGDVGRTGAGAVATTVGVAVASGVSAGGLPSAATA